LYELRLVILDNKLICTKNAWCNINHPIQDDQPRKIAMAMLEIFLMKRIKRSAALLSKKTFLTISQKVSSPLDSLVSIAAEFLYHVVCVSLN